MSTRYTSLSVLVLLFLCPHLIHSQGFWGLTNSGSTSNFGTLFHTDTAASNLIVKYSFQSNTPGALPFGDLTQASDGNYYGLTSAGDPGDAGVIFRFNPTTSVYTRMYDFSDTANGYAPHGSLIQASNGKLYGMTFQGGADGFGVLFAYDPVANTYTREFDFTGSANGASPYGSLVQTATGKLYGMTSAGGANNAGVIFQYVPSTSVVTKLMDFSAATTGSVPEGALIQATNGNLYGMTSQGGTNSMGVLFEFDTTAAKFTKLLDFNGTANGSTPLGSLIQTSAGKLYGMTSAGGANNLGLIFEYNLTADSLTDRFDFNGTTSGSNPNGSLLQATNGTLYGMTLSGGASAEGTIFSFDTTSAACTSIYNFVAGSGYNPYGTLIQGANGKLYGMSNLGGINQDGVLFNIDTAAFTYTDLIDLDGAPNGSNPEAALVMAPNGILYGTTSSGGTAGGGVIFQFDTATSTYTKLIDFTDSANGYSPTGSLLLASNGKLYGLTSAGGINEAGTLFEYAIATSTFTKKVDFDTALNGDTPLGTLIQAKDGKLYGLTSAGGAHNSGVVFSYDFNASICTKLADFDSTTTGSAPSGALFQTTTGTMYGLASAGGSSSQGVLFSFNPSTNVLANKVTFSGPNGSAPKGSLLEESNGMLAGLTSAGGADSSGVLFEYDTATAALTVRYTFDGYMGGSTPSGSLVLGPNGKLFGTTTYGGTNDDGATFEYIPSSKSVAIKQWLTAATTGNTPYGDLLFVCNTVQITAQPADTSICPGSAIQYKVGTSGGGTLAYQWYDNGKIIPGATTNPYAYTAITRADSGTIYCTITNTCGSQSSAVVSLGVNTVPAVPTISQNGSILSSSSATGNQWYLNSVALAGSTNQQLTVHSNGNYTVEVTGTDHCTSSSAPYNFIAAGIVSNQVVGALDIYPNPAQDALLVNFASAVNTRSDLTLYDLSGRAVMPTQVLEENSNGRVALDISSLSTGMYLLKVTNSGGEVSLKFMKN